MSRYMSEAENELIYGDLDLLDDDGLFDDGDELSAKDNPDVWLCGDHSVMEWREMKTSHINNVVRGINAGRQFFGQGFKLDRAIQELNKRK